MDSDLRPVVALFPLTNADIRDCRDVDMTLVFSTKGRYMMWLVANQECLGFVVILGLYLQRVGPECESIAGVDDGVPQLFHDHSTIAGRRSVCEFAMDNRLFVKERLGTFQCAVLHVLGLAHRR
jgi:hypothetical protein